MADIPSPRPRYGEAFWRAHHEAWKRSDLNQREYCESQGLSQKAFENWRAKFKAEPQPPARKLLYRRGASHRVSHSPSHTLGHSPSHGAYPCSEPPAVPIVPSARAGHRRRFSEADRRHILAEAGRPAPASPRWRGASASIGACSAGGDRRTRRRARAS